MPKLIDYPRTSYAGAWELAEVVDDTGGKCAIETAARKLNRKVSGSFKAIIGSGVKFGLLTSKRELLNTTTLFKRIKHAYDKNEELVFHREAFLTPPLFTQLCRKFRSRELPVQMLDVMLIREFGVEEINAQGVAKAFVEGARMVGLIDERNIIADIDSLAAQQGPRRELASAALPANTFRPNITQELEAQTEDGTIASPPTTETPDSETGRKTRQTPEAQNPTNSRRSTSTPDAIANLFGFLTETPEHAPAPLAGDSVKEPSPDTESSAPAQAATQHNQIGASAQIPAFTQPVFSTTAATGVLSYHVQVSGPGINTTLEILEEDDLAIAIALLEKIRRQLKASH